MNYLEYEDYLYHHGVKGMKWGVRKKRETTGSSKSNKPKLFSEEYHRQKADKAIDKIKYRRSRLGKAMANETAYLHERSANLKAREKQNANEKNILKRLDNRYGHGANAAQQKAAENYFNRQADYRKSRYFKQQSESAAYNSKTAAAANEKLHDSSSLKEYGKNYVDAIANRKIKTWSGRTTTTGEQFVDNYLTSGWGGTIKDYQYYYGNRKK